MHATAVISGSLSKNLECVEPRRQRAVWAAVDGVLRGGRASLTCIGRSLGIASRVKHDIKRVDQLLGNPRLFREHEAYFKALAATVLAGERGPLLLVDWTDLGQSFWAISAAVPVEGRAVQIYLEVHHISSLGNRLVQDAFLEKLRDVLPPGTVPIVVTDAGFQTPWFSKIEQLGWNYVGRLTSIVTLAHVDDAAAKGPARALFFLASPQARDVGLHFVTQRKHALTARIIVVKEHPRGRHGSRRVSRKGVHPGSTAYKHYQRRASEPWVLATSLRDASPRAIQLCYARRMRIEETFRDAKSSRFGWSLCDARCSSALRYANLLLVTALAMLAQILLGATLERGNAHRGFQANTTHHKRVLSWFFLGGLALHLSAKQRRLVEVGPKDFESIQRCVGTLLKFQDISDVRG